MSNAYGMYSVYLCMFYIATDCFNLILTRSRLISLSARAQKNEMTRIRWHSLAWWRENNSLVSVESIMERICAVIRDKQVAGAALIKRGRSRVADTSYGSWERGGEGWESSSRGKSWSTRGSSVEGAGANGFTTLLRFREF